MEGLLRNRCWGCFNRFYSDVDFNYLFVLISVELLSVWCFTGFMLSGSWVRWIKRTHFFVFYLLYFTPPGLQAWQVFDKSESDLSTLKAWESGRPKACFSFCLFLLSPFQETAGGVQRFAEMLYTCRGSLNKKSACKVLAFLLTQGLQPQARSHMWLLYPSIVVVWLWRKIVL